MRFLNYSDSIHWLFNQFPSYQNIGISAYKPDLGNIKALLTCIGNPQNSLRFVHVAGTNGKGSVCSMLSSVLTESGHKVGLFTSPHIKDFRERIRINGKMISESAVISFCNFLQEQQFEDHVQPSFFEISFAMAVKHFKDENCSICVIETGLGGRLDATNIVQPVLSIITNISLDHTQLLGNTIEKIATEKAGIIKPNIPLVIGSYQKDTYEVFHEIAQKQESKIILSRKHTIARLPLLGDYQKENFNTVMTSLEELERQGLIKLNPELITRALTNLGKNSGFYGRMQVISEQPLTIVDVSHNEAGIKQTLASITNLNQGKLHIIYGASSDKDSISICKTFPKDATVSFCVFENSRSLNEEQLSELAIKLNLNAMIFKNIKEANRYHQSHAEPEDTVLIFGSFFLLSDFFDFFSN
jgi:dihydrofolate synthase/folylpolyglutamate synthase